ncbi:hypothetical protein [Teredinibacter sp. KSP-S5-2]|uniref:hypothetical protein n=1 Tax=Teredinibacter sp. KSP-S5-2 TaxID=3034506 RepID=UPI00293445B9|nr:hypothetical protein [Teredinibacter sp. KSP-S5-2]WNO08394.1 hypothetical protein P5V12_15600 [Teredinibacter sp. KSP-S5-2]
MTISAIHSTSSSAKQLSAIDFSTPYELDKLLQKQINEQSSRRQLHAYLVDYVEQQYNHAQVLVAKGTISQQQLDSHKLKHTPSRAYLDNFANGQPICFRYTNTIANALDTEYYLTNFDPAEELLKTVNDKTSPTDYLAEELCDDMKTTAYSKRVSPHELDNILRHETRAYANAFSFRKLEMDMKDFVIGRYKRLKSVLLKKGVSENDITRQVNLYTLSASQIRNYSEGADVCYRYINTLANFHDYTYCLCNFNPYEELLNVLGIREETTGTFTSDYSN